MMSASAMGGSGGDEPDRATTIELTSPMKPNSHANSNSPVASAGTVSDDVRNGEMNGSSSHSNKLNWVQFDDDENGETSMNSITAAVAAAPTTQQLQQQKTIGIPMQSAVVSSTANKAEGTITTTVDLTPQSTIIQRNNRPSSSITPSDITPAVLATESIHINLNNSLASSPPKNIVASPTISKVNSVAQRNVASSTNNISPTIPIISPPPISEAGQMRTIELSTGRVREGFANGDVIVTLLPINTKWPWITPAVFRPELVPEELMAQGLTLTVEEYVNAMETLVNDYRFTLYNVCYKRVLVCWILFAFCVLLALLFSGLQGIALFSLGVGWLFLNAAAIFLCMWIKLKLSRGLEKCLARVNKQLVRHKILLVLDDRGRISCHKVNLCFLYFDPAQCVSYLNAFLERSEQNGTTIQTGWEARLDLDVSDIVIQGSNPTRVSRKQERGLLLYLRYGSRWGNEIVRGLGDVSITEPARHCANFICPCQYIERHLTCKPRGCKYPLLGNTIFDSYLIAW